MGKKMKKKVPNPRKAIHRSSTGSPRSVDQNNHEGEGGGCNHYGKSAEELNRTLSSIRSNSTNIMACEHCREEPDNKRGGTGRGKQHKKKGGARASESKKEANFVWVCLDCSRYFCGGEVSALEPYGHARRHSKQEHHMWAVRSNDPLISWCYACNSSVPIEMPQEEMDATPKLAMDLDKGVESLGLESTSKGYIVRGLSNLGNTCFFNSVMQNLLAMDMLRDYLISLDQPLGPITMALKKLFLETSTVLESKNILSPKALFGSICAKAPQFRGYQQQDSHELLVCLLDGLHVEEANARKLQNSSEETKKANLKPVDTFVDVIFGGQLSSTVCCTECGHASVVHEPFLDLSLPVPSKKSPHKKVPPHKVPPPPPKRSKPFVKERNKGKKFREKVFAKGSPVIQHCREESSDAPSECSESVVAQKPEEDVNTQVDYVCAWLDYCEDPVTQNSSGDTLDPQLVNYSEDLNILSDFHGETSCINEALSSCIQDSNIDKETDPSANQISGAASCSQTAENMVPVDEPAEVEFDGFGVGDLFNEPEVTSAPKTENETGEQLDLTLWTGNSSESNHDEVDNTNTPVSINSCLALFTKPELLSDQQAWHCERCSESAGQKKVKRKIATVFDEVESRSKNPSPRMEMDSNKLKVSGNGKVASASNNLISQDERLNLIGGLVNKEEIVNEESSNSFGSAPPRIDEEIAASDDSSQYFSCQPARESTQGQEASFHPVTDSCSINNLNSVRCRSGSSSEVNQLVKENLQLLDKGKRLDNDESEEVENETEVVKRDATKRILINRTPSILTIHLKRFSQDARGRLTKLSGHVSFQQTLDLRPYMDPRSGEEEKSHHRLIGVVEHSGSMSGGHYIAYVKGERCRGGKTHREATGSAWFYVSDAHVREASLSEVLNSDAYILFYERVQM